MQRRIVAGLLAAALMLAGASDALVAQPAPPNRFYGNLTIDGQPAPAGTVVTVVQGGRECGSRATDTPGQYWVDAASGSQTPGCGTADPVQFRVGSRLANETAAWNGGQFTRLDLTVGGPGGGTAAAQRFTLSRLDMSGRLCIPAAGATQCDATRLRLWNGDRAAWTAEFARQGRPEPSDDEVFVATYEFRIGAGDPAAIASLAQGLGWPKIYITAVRYRGSAPGEGDEYIEVTNVGGAPQDMTGWRAFAVESNTSFYFTDGSVLEPGARCRFYTGAPREDSCPGTINVATTGVWNDSAGTAELWYDPLALLADRTRYNADPNNQPPPPNLQGVTGPLG